MKLKVWRNFRAALVSATLVLSGCQKQELSAPPPIPDSVATTAVQSAEPTSFAEVARQLDAGGSFYLYLSTAKAMEGLSAKVAEMRKMAVEAVPADEADTRAHIEQLGTFVEDLIRRSGLESCTGLGASSIAVEPDLYRNKMFLHHPPGQGDGFLWNLIGGKAHLLNSLELLPQDTGMATFADIDPKAFWQFVQDTAAKSGRPEATQAIAQASATVQMTTGMSLDELLDSLGKEGGIILTLDPSQTVSLPIGDQTQSFAKPRLALLLRVNDERIFQRIDQTLGASPQVEKVDEAELKMRTMPVPFLPELGLRPTAAQWKGWLIVASHDSLVRDIIGAKGGFRSTPEFQRLSRGLPKEGNSFSVSAQRFADAMREVQRASMRQQAAANPAQTKLMEKILEWQKPGSSFAVSTRLDNGLLVVNQGSMGASRMLAPLIVAPLAMTAGIALPVYTNVSARGKQVKSLSNAKQLGLACKLYAADHDGAFPPNLQVLMPDYIESTDVLKSPLGDDPIGYDYTAGLTETSPPASVLISDRFAEQQGCRIIVRVDLSGVVEKIK